MARRGSIKTKDMERVFSKLDIKEKKCKHHVRGFVEVDGKKVFATHYSFGKKDIHGKVLSNIIRDLGADEEIFFGLTDCYLGRGDYVKNLRKKGLV